MISNYLVITISFQNFPSFPKKRNQLYPMTLNLNYWGYELSQSYCRVWEIFMIAIGWL